MLATVLVLVFGALLTSADPVFARFSGAIWPSVRLNRLPLYLTVLLAVTGLTIALAYATSSQLSWDRLALRPRPRPAAEWVLPLAAVDTVLLGFLIVQLAVLFGGYTPSLAGSGVTYADRARQGFGQLVVVTLLTLALLAWAGRRVDRGSRRHRVLLIAAGGGLVLLALAVVASALRRMWLYEQAYGWTVLRLCVACFELWLAVVLVLMAVAWAGHRSGGVPRGVALSGGICLLALAMLGPDAVVARWDVDRYQRTGKIDVEYLSRLSADAVPALACLPDGWRSQVLAGRTIADQPWYAANLARARAAEALARPECEG